jgi:hypothetical protein
MSLWPAVATASISHADRQYEMSAQRLFHTLTGSSKRQHSFSSHADLQFETSVQRLLHILTSSSKLQPTRQIRLTESQKQLQMSVDENIGHETQFVATHRYSVLQQAEET